METLLLKVALAPGLVVGVTLAARRWGSRVGGMLIALPVVAGPILLVITLEHGEMFGARAARGALLGVGALSAFCVAFAAAAPVIRWPGVLLIGWAAYVGVAACGSRWDAPPVAGLATALTALLLARAFLRRAFLRREDKAAVRSGSLPPWDLYARAGSTAVLVILLTTVAGALGPAVSGVLTPFPIAASVVAAFTLAHDGPAAALATLRGFVAVLPGFAVFFFAVAAALG
ncbi:MAG TPA: hypothetical protein VLJ42_04155 [Solirubrobacteraceae bacterium]|nr:hypothetical protein [Solirubrobacteraceae bacterium]